MAQTEQTAANTSPSDTTSLFSLIRQLLPPDETLRECEKHFVRSGVELLKGMRTIVESYMDRLEACEEKSRPERVSKIEITEEET